MSVLRMLQQAEASPDVSAELGELLDGMVAYLTTYIHFARPEQPHAIALWTMTSHLLDTKDGYPYEVVPYLLITSAEKESGKTTLLDLVGAMARSPLRVDNISSAALVRLMERRPTVLIDEVDTLFKNGDKSETAEVLRGVLNGGYRKGGVYTRWNVKANAVEQHETFGMKAMTGVGRHIPDSIVGRSVYIRADRKPRDVKLPKARERLFRVEGEELAARAKELVPSLTLEFLDMDVVGPEALSSRQQDMWEPMYVLARIAGGEWPGRVQAASLNLTASDEESMSIGQRLLRGIRAVWATENIHTAELIGFPVDLYSGATTATGLCSLEDESWSTFDRGRPIRPDQLAKALKEFGIEPRRPRVNGKQAQGYVRADFEKPWAIYLPEKAMAEDDD